jgi:hypothetical protein
MVDIFSYQNPNLGIVWRALEWIKLLLFYGCLVYFTAIWHIFRRLIFFTAILYILQPFGIFMAIWYIYGHLVYTVFSIVFVAQEKSGNAGTTYVHNLELNLLLNIFELHMKLHTRSHTYYCELQRPRCTYKFTTP